MSYSKIGLAIVGIVLVAIISYVLLKPTLPGKDCPSDEVFNKTCGQCAPKDCIPDNVVCDPAGKVAKCSCLSTQILCGGICYPNGLIYCNDDNQPKCSGSLDNIVCGTGSTTQCCQPGTECIDGICGGNCKDPQLCNNANGNQCCISTQKCLCVGDTNPTIGQCKPGNTNNNTCCSPENTIMSNKSVNGTNECCPYQAATCDANGCTGKNVDDNGKWHCCPGDFNTANGECAVACGDKDGKKIFCNLDQYCMAITDTKGATTYSCANNTCTWDSEMTYPQIKNDGYAYTTDCMNPAVFVQNQTKGLVAPNAVGISDRPYKVCDQTYNNLPQEGQDRYFSKQDSSLYESTLRFFRAKSTMDSNTGLPLCNANDCIKKLSNYGDVTEMYNELTGECWGNQTMKSYCNSEKENQTILASADPLTSCNDLTSVRGLLNYVADPNLPGMCPITDVNGGCGDYKPQPQIY